MTLPKFRKINVQPYRPGKSRLFKIKNIVKLSANESALRVSPKVKREINKKINFYKYPDNNSNNLRLAISKNVAVEKSSPNAFIRKTIAPMRNTVLRFINPPVLSILTTVNRCWIVSQSQCKQYLTSSMLIGLAYAYAWQRN